MKDSNSQNADLSALKIDRKPGKSRPSRWKRRLHLLWLLMPVIFYFGYQYTLKQVAPVTKVKTDIVHYLSGTDASAELVATGYVVAQIKAAVSSKATGRLKTLNFEEGDTVHTGQIIAELENDDIIANLDLYKAYLKLYRADSVVAASNYNRQKKLLASGHITEEVREQATAALQRAEANIEAGIAQIRAAEVAVENTIIRAPFNGTVLTKNADVGEMVAPLAASSSSRGAVVTMADMSSLEVEADVSESNIQKVIENQPCEIILDAYPEVRYKGYVKKIVPTADRSRATVIVKVAFKNKDERVLPEMSARVTFMPISSQVDQARAARILVVDNDAVVMRDGKKVVFKYDDGNAYKVNVTLGKKLGDVTEIMSGLSSRDMVILNPHGGLNDGDKVEISQ